LAAQLFILSSKAALDEICPEVRGLQTALVLFRDERGPLSFNTSEPGQHVLRAIFRGAAVVRGDGELFGFCDACDLKQFHATVLGRAGLCVYGPDSAFMDNVEKSKAYIRDHARSKLLMKYGREASLPAQPLLHQVFFDRRLSDKEMGWLAEHSKAIAIWRCVTGAELQPILSGPGQTEILAAVKAVCEVHSVEVNEVQELAELPNW